MPMLVDLARLHPARGCVWRRCQHCHDLCVLPVRVLLCTGCSNRAGRRPAVRP